MKLWYVLLLVAGCADGPKPAVQTCDGTCPDEVAVRGVRETIKFVFNLTLQGKPVGAHDESMQCPLGGSARVYGTATSNAEQGATFVSLTYELAACAFAQADDDPEENYAIVTTGTFTQEGTLAVQPSSTSALTLQGAAVTITGAVFDPPSPYDAQACSFSLMQNGNHVAGSLCARPFVLGL